MLSFIKSRARQLCEPRAASSAGRARARTVRRQPALDGLEDRCLLSNTVILFDDLLPRTVLTNQYHIRGVDFTRPDWPVITPVASGQAQSGSQIAVVAPPSGSGLYLPRFSGFFTRTHTMVSVAVGLYAMIGSPNTAQITLTAYNSLGNQVGQNGPVTVTLGNGYHSVLTVNSRTANIASFVITGNSPYDDKKSFGIDDLTYDNTTTAKPDFVFLPAFSPIALAPGLSTTTSIQIERINGSSGGISFAASGLPTGVTATFQPSTTPWSSTSLTMTAATSAPTIYGKTITVIGTPMAASAGSIVHTLDFKLDVRPDFSFSSVPLTMVLSCNVPVQVPVSVTRVHSFSSRIDVSLSGQPSYITPVFKPSSLTLPPSGLINTLSLTLTAGVPYPVNGSSFLVRLKGTSGREVVSSAPIHIIVLPAPKITSATPNIGSPPIALQPGTEVDLKGSDFDASHLIEFGNSYALAAPFFVSADHTEMKVRVPRLATDGNLGIIPPGGATIFTSAVPFRVVSFRNTNGWAFQNFYDAGYTLNDLVELYGAQQVYLPLPGNPTNPLALTYLNMVNTYLSGGQCFGMSLSSQRLYLGQEPYSAFPAQSGLTASTAWNLDGPSAPSSQAQHYIHIEHMAQWSVEAQQALLASQAVSSVYGAAGVEAMIVSAFNQGNCPIISIYKNMSGHAVIAYNLEDDGSGTGGFYIDVYDNNVSFKTQENTNAPLHQSAENNSRIHVQVNGTWSFENLGWSSTLSNLYVTPISSIPVQPHLWTPGSSLSTVWLSGAAKMTQISDRAGHTLLNPNGSLNTNAAKRLRDAAMLWPYDAKGSAPYFVLGGSTGSYTQTITGTGTGTYNLTVLNSNLTAQFQKVTSTKGVQDQVMLNPKGSIGFMTTAATKAVTVGLIGTAVDQKHYSAVLTTKALKRGMDSVVWDASALAFTYKHTGAATQYKLTFNGFDAQGRTVKLNTVGLQLKNGETASFQALDWKNLRQAGVKMTLTRANGKQQQFLLKNNAPPIEYDAQ